MNGNKSTLRIIAEHFGGAMALLDRSFRDEAQFRMLMRRLGWNALALPVGYTAIADSARATIDAVAALEEDADLVAVLDVIDGIGAVFRALDGLSSAPPGVDATVFLSEIGRRLSEYVLSDYLNAAVPGLFSTLQTLGIIAFEDVPPADGRPGYVRLRFDWEKLPETLLDPASIPDKVYGWGTPDFDFSKVTEGLSNLFLGLGLPGSIDLVGPELSDALQSEATGTPAKPIQRGFTILFFDLPIGDEYQDVGFAINELPAEGSALPGLVVRPMVPPGIGSKVDLIDGWSFAPRTGSEFSEDLAIVLRPGETSVRFPLAPGHSFPSAGLGASLTYDTGEPVLLFGEPGNIRLELARATFSTELDLIGGDLDLRCGIQPDGLALVLSGASLDNFLGSLLGGSELRIAVPIGLSWSSRSGLDFLAGAGFEISLYPNLDLAVVRIDGVDLAVKFLVEQPAQLVLQATASFSGAIGPISYSVDRLGVELPIVFEDGNAGPFDITFRMVPPAGLGLGVDAGVVSGGGFLRINPDAGEYAGVLDLDLLTVGISAIGLVDTKLPGGGWSFFLGLFIDVPSIPLGFGFTLNGVGGLAGINRTLDAEGLRSAIRSGSLDGVLFPEDPIADAPMIIEAVQSIFPSAEGRYVFGPVVKIGWGTPTLIEAEIGIAIALPDPIVIAVLGSVTAVLPTPDADIVALHLEVAGIIDTGAASLSIDASLHGSHIVGFPLSGDMALRSAFGDAPSFLMALGGNHPGFDRPDKFPTIDRLSLAINAGNLIDIRFECYFAVASNSVQFGAAFEMTAEVEGFGINGGASFDALINFSPFSLQTDLGYHISVKAAGVDLLAVWLDVRLSGPNPWHVVGTATFTILGFDNTIKLDQKIGSKEREEPPVSEDVLDQVRAAVALPEAWSVGAGGGRGVVFAADDPLSDELVVTPDGTLGVTQRVVPLGITIDKSEPWQIEGGYNRFDLESEESGMASTGSLTDWFVVSSYKDLGPREQLSAPSFDRLKSGIEFGGGDPTAGPARMGTLEYEQILRDPELDDAAVKLSPFNLSADPRTAGLAEMATSQVTTGFTVAAEDAPPTVVSAGYAAIDELTGAVLGRKPSWTASRLSTVGRKAGVTVVPAWEVAE